jgi:phosphoinositide-3-kinase regulatory subunit 4
MKLSSLNYLFKYIHFCVQLYFKANDDNTNLSKYEAKLVDLLKIFNLKEHPNVLPYQRFFQSSKSNVAFLLRQYFHSTLTTRVSMRPFLTSVEKRWIVFLLLQALHQAHSSGVVHLDIKSENIMVTSWNWVFLTDFATFKPIYLPDDDPTLYYYFHQTAVNGKCYLAPERLQKLSRGDTKAGADGPKSPVTSSQQDKVYVESMMDSNIKAEEVEHIISNELFTHDSDPDMFKLLQAMDIFSVGCVIAELFTDGEALFDLSALLKYKAGSDEVLASANKIEDVAVREMVLHMIHRDPSSRLTAKQYIDQFSNDGNNSLFPPSYSYLFESQKSLIHSHGLLPDARVKRVCADYDKLIEVMTGSSDPLGALYFTQRLNEVWPVNVSTDEKKDNSALQPDDNINLNNSSNISDMPSNCFDCDLHHEVSNSNEENSLVLVIVILCAAIRSTRRPSVKLTILRLLSRLSAYTTDEVRLQRMVPYVISLIGEGDSGTSTVQRQSEHVIIRALSIRVLTKVN